MPSRTFPAYPDSVPEARRYVTEALGHLPTDTCQVVALLVSELVTNAVRYADGEFRLTIELTEPGGTLWVGVTDSDPAQPILLRPPVTAEHGRGLQLVSTLADRWGVRRRRGTEKTVWFELATPFDSPARGPARQADDDRQDA